jgi:hypothetical protein
MSADTGGPAFPIKQYNRNIMAFEEVCGMTLRDYFAAKAMQGIVSHDPTFSQKFVDLAVKDAYVYADAMLKARGQ